MCVFFLNTSGKLPGSQVRYSHEQTLENLFLNLNLELNLLIKQVTCSVGQAANALEKAVSKTFDCMLT